MQRFYLHKTAQDLNLATRTFNIIGVPRNWEPRQCSARAVSSFVGDNEVIMSKEGQYDHIPDNELAKVERIKFNLEPTILFNLEQGPLNILRNVWGRTTAGVIAHLPVRVYLKNSMLGTHRRNLPHIPKNYDELREVPQDFWNVFDCCHQCLLYDSVDHCRNRGRELSFATRRNIQILAGGRTRYFDVGFKVILTHYINFALYRCFRQPLASFLWFWN